MAPMLDSLSAEIENELGELLTPSTPLKMIASHDLALDLLRERFNSNAETLLNVQYRGSLDAVRQLVANHCEIAGYHVPERASVGQIESGFSRLMPIETYQSIHFATRRQGLMVAKGNHHAINKVADLVGSGLRFLNRQRGSGTRLLFDELLADAGVEASEIAGYEAEEFTHLAVAAMLASGAADVGFGVQAAAERFDLGFKPLIQEVYLLAVRKADLETAWCQTLLRTLRQDGQLRDQIGALSGYDCHRMGQLVNR